MASSLTHTLGYLFTLNATWGRQAHRPATLGRWPAREERDQRSNFRQAAARAYRGFARAHPQWAAALFDEYFLTRRMEARLLDSLTGAAPLNAAGLARAWADQFGPGCRAHLERQMAELVPAAADYLNRLAAEFEGG